MNRTKAKEKMNTIFIQVKESNRIQKALRRKKSQIKDKI